MTDNLIEWWRAKVEADRGDNIREVTTPEIGKPYRVKYRCGKIYEVGWGIYRPQVIEYVVIIKDDMTVVYEERNDVIFEEFV
jgi:hypothetical protein